MSVQTKSAALQAYRLVLYRRALHPELFNVKSRKTFRHGDYEFEGWVMSGAHMMRFQHDGMCVTELVTPQEAGLPERGLVAAIPCAGEKDHEQPFGNRLDYLATIQTETLPENLYKATYRELLDFAEEGDADAHLWTDSMGGQCASILDVQRFRREVHAQSYHLHAQGGLILRTQTIFEHK